MYDLWFWCVCVCMCIYSLCKSSLLTPFDGCLFHIQELRTCSSVSTPRLKCVRELIVPELHFDSICNWLQQSLCGGKTIWKESHWFTCCQFTWHCNNNNNNNRGTWSMPFICLTGHYSLDYLESVCAHIYKRAPWEMWVKVRKIWQGKKGDVIHCNRLLWCMTVPTCAFFQKCGLAFWLNSVWKPWE